MTDSVHSLLEQYRSGARSPVEVVRDSLERIESLDGTINAFRTVNGEAALEEAAECEARWRAGTPRGPLEGVPISVKDTLMVEGFAFRQGSLALADEPATESAPVVQRARDAGAIVLGVTCCSEFGSSALTVSALTGVTRNPSDPSKHAGGSSGGAAASVAAGMVPLALGSDAAGSVRIPASFCGVVGLKPSGGLVPAYPRNVGGLLSSPGVLTTNVRDAASALGVIARPDRRDVEAVPSGEDYCQDLEAGLTGLRLVFSRTFGYGVANDPEVEQLVAGAVKTCEQLGAQVEERDPGFEDPEGLIAFFLAVGYSHTLGHLNADQLELLNKPLRERISEGGTATAKEYLEVQDRRLDLGRRMEAFYENADLLITPTLPVPAFSADSSFPESFPPGSPSRSWTKFVYPFNLTQQPAISVPCGLTRSGLPVGVQMIGPRRGDALVLRSAFAYETARG